MNILVFNFLSKGDYSHIKIMLLFKEGPISFELMDIFGFSFRLTSPKNKFDLQTKSKKVLK